MSSRSRYRLNVLSGDIELLEVSIIEQGWTVGGDPVWFI